MKIKDVIGRTGLTDRAIRLYISNGLISPHSEKSYTGRSSFDFSEADVALLQQIALLRKADFSLEQIHALQQGGDAALTALTDFRTRKQEEIQTSQTVLTALSSLPSDAAPSMDEICRALTEGFQKAAVPAEDMQPTKQEKREAWLYRFVCIPVLLFFGLSFFGMLITYGEEYPFPKLYTNPVNHIAPLHFLLPIILSAAILRLYAKPRFTPKKRKKRRFTANILLAVMILSILNPFGWACAMLIPPVFSETENPTHYLQLGTYERMYADDLNKLFPANIPRSAIAEGSAWYPPDKFPDTTKYYYLHENLVDPNFELFAQWVLPEAEYGKEKQRIQTYYPEGPVYQEQRGDWTCLHFTDCREKPN